MIEVVSADKLIFDQKRSEAQRVIGNVQVKHENTTMYCDSAWIFQKKGKLYAFGHLHMKQGDSLNVYGDSLFYDANLRYGKMRGHVRMVELDMNMETDSIEFDAKEGRGWYTNGGIIRSARNKNTLTSRNGEYRSKSKDIFFSDSVRLNHPEYTMQCDTLRYHTPQETAFFSGPTTIRTNSGLIFCENGWYNTRTDESFFSKNAFLSSKEHLIHGDSIRYNRKTGKGSAHGKFQLQDTLNAMIAEGKRAQFDEVKGTSMITDSAVLIRKFEKDSLYIHADTLYGFKNLATDKQHFVAWHHVRFFKSDLQGICDSLNFSEGDSLLQLMGTPVIWHQENQLSAVKMNIRFKEKTIDRADLYDDCFIASQVDSTGYNQIKGRSMHAVFVNEQLSQIDIKGNGQTIYYAGEEGKKRIGMNKAECSDIRIRLAENKISAITFITEPEAVFYPMDRINPKDKLLKDFKWHGNSRPKNKSDIFRHE